MLPPPCTVVAGNPRPTPQLIENRLCGFLPGGREPPTGRNRPRAAIPPESAVTGGLELPPIRACAPAQGTALSRGAVLPATTLTTPPHVWHRRSATAAARRCVRQREVRIGALEVNGACASGKYGSGRWKSTHRMAPAPRGGVTGSQRESPGISWRRSRQRFGGLTQGEMLK